MKLRLNGDSIRLRLSPSDVAVLQQTGQVRETTHFGGNSEIEYGLKTRDGANEVRATFDDGKLLIEVPKAVSDEWMESEEVGISHRQSLPGGVSLKILIEKDFECLHSDEKEAGVVLFPNPRLAGR